MCTDKEGSGGLCVWMLYINVHHKEKTKTKHEIPVCVGGGGDWVWVSVRVGGSAPSAVLASVAAVRVCAVVADDVHAKSGKIKRGWTQKERNTGQTERG